MNRIVNQRMAIIGAPGSRGDVNPLLDLAKELLSRGWRVRVGISGPYAHLAEKLGCETRVIVSSAEFQTMLENTAIWRPVRGARLVLKHAATEFGNRFAEQLSDWVVPGHTILIAHPLDFASRVFKLAHPETPLVNLHLAPSTLYTPSELSRYHANFVLRRPEWLIRGLYRIANQYAIRKWIMKGLQPTWERFGVRPQYMEMHQWWSLGGRTIGFYPEWFGPAHEAYLSPIDLVGFPLARGTIENDIVKAHPTNQPMVFTAGTAHGHAQRFFELAVEVCQALQVPGLLLSSQPSQFPKSLPTLVSAANYIPFADLLPHCRLMIHHGGIGTTSESLAAGIPQLVLPMAFDQFDNAARVERLGCGRWFPFSRLTATRLETAIKEMLADPRYRSNATPLRSKLDGPAAISAAANLIEAHFTLSLSR